MLLPVYNAAPFLRETIDSILNQSFRDFELLAINDGSTDESRSILLSYNDPRIRLIDNPRNIGLIATLNKGIAEAKGKYIARIDADDVAAPERLQKQYEALERDAGIAVLASFVALVNTDGEVTGEWSTDRSTTTEAQIRSMMVRTNCIAHPSVMMRTETAKKYGYNPRQKGAEDWDLWLRILAGGHRIAKLPEVLLNYRIHPGSIMAGDKRKEALETRLVRVKRKFLGSQLLRLRLNGVFFGTFISLLKNVARHFVSNKLPACARDAKRFITSSPFAVLREARQFKNALQQYNGRHYFIFPYTHVGGAEKVHAEIVAAVRDRQPLVIFSAFSDNEKFLSRFRANATVLNVPHYINYPLTRRKAKHLLAEKLNAGSAVLLGSNSGLFYDLIPLLGAQVKNIELIHAFKYQPEANLAHKALLPLAARIDQRVFVSEAARQEFDKFLFHNNVPSALRKRLLLISNGVLIPQLLSEAHERTGILFVGRDSAEKRLHLFLRTVEVLAQAMPGKIHGTVVGVASSAVSGTVAFKGEITDEEQLRRIYQQHDILLLTSSREGFPVVIMEAMANGLVVVATPVGDIPNRLNGSNGIVLSSADENAVVNEAVALITALIHDPEKMKAVRTEARNYAIGHFSMEQFQQAYRALLDAE